MKLNLAIVCGFLVLLTSLQTTAVGQEQAKKAIAVKLPSIKPAVKQQQQQQQVEEKQVSEDAPLKAAQQETENAPATTSTSKETTKSDSTSEQTDVAKTLDSETKRLERKPGQWTPLNKNFEVKRINPADLKLRGELPSIKAELEWQISILEEADKPIPESLKNFEPLQILSAIISPGGKLFLSTSDGLVRYGSGDSESSFVRDEASKIIQAAGLARDPVDGILIGLQGESKVLELRESGKLVSRGQLAPLNEGDDEDEDKNKLSVTHLVSSGSDYLALSSNAVYRRLPEGHWEKQSLQTINKLITKFALLESREIATTGSDSSDVMINPQYGIARKIQVSEESGHASNQGNILIDSIHDMKVKKLVPLVNGDLFCVFARVRVPTETPLDQNPFNDDHAVTAGGCSLSGSSFDDLVTSNDFDWGVDGLPEKDRTVVDLLPGPSGEPKDVWFVTPEGLGLFADKKTEFWKSQFKLDRKGVELSRIDDLGDGCYMVYTTDGVHGEDVFFIRPKK